MKIYTKIRIDIDTGEVIEEESFEHNGPIAMAMPSTGGSDPGSGGDDTGHGSGGGSGGSPGGGSGSGAGAAERSARGGAAGDYGGIGGAPGMGGENTYGYSDDVAQSLYDTYRSVYGVNMANALMEKFGLSAKTDKAASTAPAVTEKEKASLLDTVWSGVKTALSIATGDFASAFDNAKDFAQNVIDQMENDPSLSEEEAVSKAASNLGIDLDEQSINQIASAIDNSLDGNGGEGRQILNKLVSTKSAAAPSTTNYNFQSYEDALRYSTASAAKRADEAWAMYKDYVVPYEEEFYTKAKELIDPQMELAGAYLDSQIQQMPGYTQAAINFYDEAVNGVDPEQRANEAQAEVEQALKNSDQQTMRTASRMGLDLNDSSVLDSIKTNSLDRARGIAGARTEAKDNAETENFGRLAAAAQLRPGSGESGINFASGNVTNPISTASNQSGQAMSGITSGLNMDNAETNQQLAAYQIKQNESYEPSFGDLLINTALSGLSKTDWSKIF